MRRRLFNLIIIVAFVLIVILVSMYIFDIRVDPNYYSSPIPTQYREDKMHEVILSPLATPLEKEEFAKDDCIVTGCSSQICTSLEEKPDGDPCIYLPVYQCYRSATCERQDTGKCNWTETPELQQCISSY